MDVASGQDFDGSKNPLEGEAVAQGEVVEELPCLVIVQGAAGDGMLGVGGVAGTDEEVLALCPGDEAGVVGAKGAS
ncbi:hypothetical protein ASF71_18040 [Deinococcus sp. Leaf326]|nr:hypothetical protein ASF71_18040 [Deinococcus sp. Leaf326]